MIIPQNFRVVKLNLHEIPPMGSQGIPGLFNGNTITVPEVMAMMIDKKLCGARQQINDSTFANNQTPTITGENKRWNRVVRPPNLEDRKPMDIPWATTIGARYLEARQPVL